MISNNTRRFLSDMGVWGHFGFIKRPMLAAHPTKEHMMLRKTAIHGLVALSIVAAPITAPAAMAKDNIDRLLLGLVAVGVAGAIAHEVNDNKRKRTTHRARPVFDPHTEDFKIRHRHGRTERHRHGNIVHRHKLGADHHRGGHSAHKRQRSRDDVGVVPSRKRHKDRVHRRHVQKSPPWTYDPNARNCLRKRWTDNGWVKFYSKRCLRRIGY